MKTNKKFTKKATKADKKVTHALIHITCTPNNTICAISDTLGNVFSSCSAGGAGFKGSKKTTPYAAQNTVEKTVKPYMPFLKTADVIVRGINYTRDSSVRQIAACGVEILSIKDATTVAHNGCRPPKRRRN